MSDYFRTRWLLIILQGSSFEKQSCTLFSQFSSCHCHNGWYHHERLDHASSKHAALCSIRRVLYPAHRSRNCAPHMGMALRFVSTMCLLFVHGHPAHMSRIDRQRILKAAHLSLVLPLPATIPFRPGARYSCGPPARLPTVSQPAVLVLHVSR